MQPHDDRLKGWKEIAGFLHSSVRTVQRWEQHLHLPVHRIAASGRSIIYASRHELEVWLESAAGRSAMSGCQPGISDERDAPAAAADSEPARRAVWLGVGVAALIVAAAAAWLYLPGGNTRGSAQVGAASPASGGAGSPMAQALFLKFANEGQRPAIVGLTPGSLGVVGAPGGDALGMMPAIIAGRLELRVYRLTGKTPAGQPQPTELSRHWLDPDVPVGIDVPGGRASVEWVSSVGSPYRVPDRR